jgi:hypothetical protein
MALVSHFSGFHEQPVEKQDWSVVATSFFGFFKFTGQLF